MKIDANETEKISNALEDLEGWEVERFQYWESAAGDLKSTIRLTKTEVE